MKEIVAKELNEQMIREFYSGYLYLSMAGYFDSVNLKGFANWMKMQAREEISHGMMFYNFLLERGSKVELSDIEAVPARWKSPLEVFEDTLEHEKKVSAFINSLVDLAISESDHACNNFLQWFVKEQVEEESSVDDVLQKLKLIGDSKESLFMLDKELGQRVFVAPESE